MLEKTIGNAIFEPRGASLMVTMSKEKSFQRLLQNKVDPMTVNSRIMCPRLSIRESAQHTIYMYMKV